MLVLSRNPGQSIVIKTSCGERVEVAIVERCGRKVRFRITAPLSVKVLRGELEIAQAQPDPFEERLAAVALEMQNVAASFWEGKR